MSSIIEKVSSNLNKLPEILASYEADLENIEEIIKLKGKTISEANKENPSWIHYFQQRTSELKVLVDYFELQVNRVRGSLFKQYTENYQRELSERAKEKYIDHEEKFVQMNEIYLEIKELYLKFQGVVDALNARGYALNNLTKLIVAEAQHEVL